MQRWLFIKFRINVVRRASDMELVQGLRFEERAGSIVPILENYSVSGALEPDGSWARSTDRHDDQHLLAIEGQSLVTFVKFRLEPGTYHLCYAFTAPGHRGRGLGSAVIEEFLSRAAASHPNFEVVTEIVSENSEAVEAILRKRGFRQAGSGWCLKLSDLAHGKAV